MNFTSNKSVEKAKCQYRIFKNTIPLANSINLIRNDNYQLLSSNFIPLTLLIIACLVSCTLSSNVSAQSRKNKKKSAVTTTTRNVNLSANRTFAPPPVITLVEPTRIYNRGDAITVEVIGGAGGGFESYIASSSINIPNDGRYNIGNVNSPGLYILRFISRGGVEKYNYGVLILPTGTNNTKFTVKLTSQVTTAEVPVESSNALIKFWGAINQTRIKRAWNDAFPNWLATQGPGVVAIGITCTATIAISGGTVLGLCFKEVGGATFDLITSVFSKLADNLRTEGVLNQNEARIVKAVFSLLKNAPGLIIARNVEFGEIVAGLKTLNEVFLEEHQDLQLVFSLVLDSASRANFMFDVKRRVNP